MGTAKLPTSKLAYPTWRTYQMSDQLPMWIELRADFSQQYLEGLEEPSAAKPAADAVPAINLPRSDDGRDSPRDERKERLP
jgi:hypothetical protein